MVYRGHCRSHQVGDPVRRSRHLRTEQSRTLNGTSSCNCPLASPGGNVINLSNPSFSSNCLGISWICVF